MQKIFIISFIISTFGFLNAAEMNFEISEKIDISSDSIEIKKEKIEFRNNVIFQSESYEIFGEIAEYDRNIESIKIEGSPVIFKIKNEGNNFIGSSNTILIKENEIEISGNVSIEDNSSKATGEIIILNISSGELKIK